MIGTFHLVCAYFRIVGKKMRCMGLSDIMIESGLISTGSLIVILLWTNYSRCLHAHKTILESIERLLLEQLILSKYINEFHDGINEEPANLLKELTLALDKYNFEKTIQNIKISMIIDEYIKFKTESLIKQVNYEYHIWITYGKY